MTETQLLIGSLSNDLFRVATLAQRGSGKAAIRFLKEAQRWSKQLQNHQIPQYIHNLTIDISHRNISDISLPSAETYLMYGVLLQNYSMQNAK